MKPTTHSAMAMLMLVSGCMAQQPEEVPVKEFYQIEVNTISGESAKMEQYKGKVLLIVNTASKCGFTPQYEGLQSLYEKYSDRGFVVLGFPSNDFLSQEPGSNEEIDGFCKINYGVTFPMFEKITVKGSGQHPLYAYLTSKETDPEFAGKITWNFNKFLISRDGRIVNRFGSRTKPDDADLVSAIETELAE
jgi:glutathione peroxidase